MPAIAAAWSGNATPRSFTVPLLNDEGQGHFLHSYIRNHWRKQAEREYFPNRKWAITLYPLLPSKYLRSRYRRRTGNSTGRFACRTWR
jgi:hypothetical protein